MGTKMTARAVIFVCLLGLASQPAFGQFAFPVSTPEHSAPDPDLKGVWKVSQVNRSGIESLLREYFGLILNLNPDKRTFGPDRVRLNELMEEWNTHMDRELDKNGAPRKVIIMAINTPDPDTLRKESWHQWPPQSREIPMPAPATPSGSRRVDPEDADDKKPALIDPADDEPAVPASEQEGETRFRISLLQNPNPPEGSLDFKIQEGPVFGSYLPGLEKPPPAALLQINHISSANSEIQSDLVWPTQVQGRRFINMSSGSSLSSSWPTTPVSSSRLESFEPYDPGKPVSRKQQPFAEDPPSGLPTVDNPHWMGRNRAFTISEYTVEGDTLVFKMMPLRRLLEIKSQLGPAEEHSAADLLLKLLSIPREEMIEFMRLTRM